METIEFRNKAIDFGHFSGTVIDQHMRETVSVSSEVDPLGGVHVGGSYIPGQKIVSEVHSSHDIWLRLDDGKEKSVSLSNSDLKLRTGQRLSFVVACSRKTQKSVYCGVYNHNADQYTIIRYPIRINSDLKIHHCTLLGSMLTIIIWIATAIITSSLVAATITSLLYIAFFCVPKIRRTWQLNQKIEKLIDNYIAMLRTSNS